MFGPTTSSRIRTCRLGLRVFDRYLVRELDLDICAGEMWCMLGVNGAGKSTLLRAMAGLQKIHDGSILYSNRPAADIEPLQMARTLGFMPHTVRDSFGTKVLDVVLASRHPRLSLWQWDGDEDWAIAYQALSAVGVKELAGRDVMTLSEGERQRVSIASLLAQDVDALLLDEPVASLDLHHQILVLDHLASLSRAKKSIIYSVHDINLAYVYSTHCILFQDDGRILHGPTHQVMTSESLSYAFKHPISVKQIDGNTLFVTERDSSTS